MRLLLVIIYLAFISLGLPDSLLGSAWPSMFAGLQSTLEFAGVIYFTINFGTIVSSLLAGKILHLYRTQTIVAVSIILSAISLYLFSISQNVYVLVALAIPYGLAAGCVDAALNHYVANHLQSKHMNYLHSFWGVGAATGPLILAIFISQQEGWRDAYLIVATIQFALAVFVLSTLKTWQKNTKTANNTEKLESASYVSNSQALRIPLVKYQLFIMFCYCSLEATTGLWAASFLIYQKNVNLVQAAFWVSMFFVGITIGRFFSGYMTKHLSEINLIRLGLFFIFISSCLLFLPLVALNQLAIFLLGLGCAPIYPNTVHLIPQRFDKNSSATIIGLSMASAYIGTTAMAPLFGWLAKFYSFNLLPIVLIIYVGIMFVLNEILVKKNT